MSDTECNRTPNSEKPYPGFYALSVVFAPFILIWLRFRSPERYRLLMFWRYLHNAYRKKQYGKAERLAGEYLALAEKYQHEDRASYGNAIHTSHQILGLIRLHEGNLEQAKQHLLLAGHTPGSPNLNSYGPRMPLARELLLKGQRGVVLQYLDLVAKFWAPGTDAKYRQLDRRNNALIRQWKTEIRGGGIPHHKMWT